MTPTANHTTTPIATPTASPTTIQTTNHTKKPTTKRITTFMRILAIFLTAIFTASFTTLLTACNSNQTPWLGDYNYNAPVAWIEPVSKEDGDYLEYRQILDLEGMITSTDLPIVICVRQSTDPAASTVIPQMEDWAYRYSGKAWFIFADASAQDPLLASLQYTTTPTFFLIQKGAVQMYASWQEENALKLLEEALNKQIQGG